MALLPSPNRLSHRCDNCHNSSKKCDRILPRCGLCVKRNLSCGIKRELKNFKKLAYIDGNILQFNIKTKHNIRKIKADQHEEEAKKNNKDKNHKTEELKTLLYTEHSSKNVNAAFVILNLIPTRVLRNSMLAIMQFPSLNSKNPGLTLLVSLATRLVMFKPKLNMTINKMITHGDQIERKELLTMAANLFVFNEHRFMAIFNVSKFDVWSLPFYTRTAIFACGLASMPKNEKIKQLHDELSLILKEKFSKPYNVEPNLENLGAIYTIFSHFREFLWAVKLTLQFNYYMTNTCFKLGLHLPCNSLRLDAQLQRQKLYNMILFNNAFFGLNVDATVGGFTRYPKSKRISHKIENELSNVINQFKNPYEVMEFYTSLFNDFISDAGWVYHNFSLIKNKLILKSTTFDASFNDIFKILIECKKLFTRFICIFSFLNQTDANFRDHNTSNAYIIYVKSLYHYIHFFALSLRFYHTNAFDNTDTLAPPLSLKMHINMPQSYEATYVNLSVYQAIKCVESATSLELNQFSRISFGIIPQLMVFLERNKEGPFKDSIISVLKKARNVMVALSEPPYELVLVQMNLWTFDNCSNLLKYTKKKS